MICAMDEKNTKKATHKIINYYTLNYHLPNINITRLNTQDTKYVPNQ